MERLFGMGQCSAGCNSNDVLFSIAAFSAWFITDFKDKVIVQIILWSQLILMGPLIVASPIAIRCFYVTYIFFVLYLGVLLSYSIRSGFLKISKGYLNTGS